MNRDMKLWEGFEMRRLAGCAVGDGDGDDEQRCP